jgi:hypothetical protein
MPMMTTLSLSDLRTKPVATISANIGNWIKDNFTRRQILEFLFEVSEGFPISRRKTSHQDIHHGLLFSFRSDPKSSIP